MQELVNALNDNKIKLHGAIEQRYKAAISRAKAEYEYRVVLGTEMAKAKDNGMAATALYEYCRGLENVASLRQKRDIAQIQEDFSNEMIYYYRVEIRIAEGQLEAERRGL